jgi:hypothetical protein
VDQVADFNATLPLVAIQFIINSIKYSFIHYYLLLKSVKNILTNLGKASEIAEANKLTTHTKKN